MKIEKTRTYIETMCDFCGESDKRTFLDECIVCKKDVCNSCAYSISKKLGDEIAIICPECFKKLGIEEK